MTAVHVLVPVKELGLAKTRLGHVLDADARAELVLAMLVDTLTAVSGVDGADTTVVTCDPVVARLARSHGARVLADPPGTRIPDPLNTALAAAADVVRRRAPGVDLVALQADLPALRAAELGSALDAARSLGRAVVPDHTGSGTAALLHCRPDAPLHPRFGPGSADRHIASGAHPLTRGRPGLRHDVDTVDDLAAVARIGVGAATMPLLVRLGFGPGRGAARSRPPQSIGRSAGAGQRAAPGARLR